MLSFVEHHDFSIDFVYVEVKIQGSKTIIEEF